MHHVKSETPETRPSLILRLANADDAEAWEEFVAIYRPLVYRLARTKGLQDADAHEIAQEVLIAVSRAVERWDPRRERGRFRDWLFRIARNLMINFLTRRKHRPLGSGGSAMADWLETQCDPACEESSTFDLEYRREVFRWASEQVRRQVREKTWSAFWLSSVEGRAISEVARELDMTVGAVHIARSRVMTRLRETGGRFDSDDTARKP